MSQETSLSDFFEDCTICYTSSTVSPVVTTPCNHKFHLSCLVTQVQTNGGCPTCRTVIAPETLASLSESVDQTVAALISRIGTLEKKTEDQANELTYVKQLVSTLERQMTGLRGQIRVLEDVLSVRVNRGLAENVRVENNVTNRVMTRASTARNNNASTSIAPSQSTVSSAPSSVRQTGSRSLMMRKWRQFRHQQTFILRNRYPNISGRAIQEMIRKEWNDMTPDQKNNVQL